MAKAATSPSADYWPQEGLPIDEALARIASPLWDSYLAWLAAAKGLAQNQRYVPTVDLYPEVDRRLARSREAKAALDAELRKHLEQQFELWARPDPTMAARRIPSSMIGGWEIDYRVRTARKEGLPPLCDVRLRPPALFKSKKLRNTLVAVVKAVVRDIFPGGVPKRAPAELLKTLGTELDRRGILASPTTQLRALGLRE
jgi:hypothetical protein